MSEDNKNLENNVGNLMPLDLEDELKKSFISYAMAVIVSRALPDVRDGLKPVHRRILYSMVELGVTPDKPHRKSARIVGDCLGKYHPHGDSSVYDAMVRLAQDFTIRYTLVDGQGNFGSIDGDGAAAMRYTEARLTKLSMEMVADIEKETVDFYPNFDETLMQPEVLPSRFPNLLVNGSNGIAVGMATNIPPHNLGEVIDGCVHMLENPECTTSDLMNFIQGPDFPTGALILGKAGIRAAYETGRGRIITRAKTNIEDMGGNRQRIVVTEIPYMVNKARLVEKMAQLVHDKRLEGISDIRDESDREGMRIVVELKKDVNASVVLNTLYKHTQMQETFGAIMLALVNGEPKILSLRQMVHHYLEHQVDVITRRTRYELNKAEARAHILEGLLIALDHIDEVISIIRSSKTDAIARDRLMETFKLSEKQAVAILDMRMRRLTGLERDKIKEEHDELEKQIAYYRAVLSDEKMVREIIRNELLEIKRKYADARRTEIIPFDGEIDDESLIDDTTMVVTMTHRGYIKRIPLETYRAQNRGGRGITGATARDEEDFVEQMYTTGSKDWMLFFTNRGRMFRMKCYQLPEAGRTAQGNAIINLLQLDPGESIATMLPLPALLEENQYLVMATRKGLVKRVNMSYFAHIHKGGIKALTLREEDELIAVRRTNGSKKIFLATHQGMSILFDENNVRSQGRTAAGVRAIRLNAGDYVVDASIWEDGAELLCISENGYGKRTNPDCFHLQSRGGKGLRSMRLNEQTGNLAAQLMVHENEDLLAMTDDGVIIRIPIASISSIGRVTKGVRIMKVAEGSKIVCVARADADSIGNVEESAAEMKAEQEEALASGNAIRTDIEEGTEDPMQPEYAAGNDTEPEDSLDYAPEDDEEPDDNDDSDI